MRPRGHYCPHCSAAVPGGAAELDAHIEVCPQKPPILEPRGFIKDVARTVVETAIADPPTDLDHLLKVIAAGIELFRNELEYQIAATPTGPRRNRLCDANIHIGEALLLLRRTE